MNHAGFHFFFGCSGCTFFVKSDGAGATVVLPFCLSHTIYCVKARAIFNAPLPSLPKNNKAWLNRFCFTICTKCSVRGFCPIISENCIAANLAFFASTANKRIEIHNMLKKRQTNYNRETISSSKGFTLLPKCAINLPSSSSKNLLKFQPTSASNTLFFSLCVSQI